MASLSALTVLFIPVLVLSTSALDIRYVRPNSRPIMSCPGQPCLTLDQYAEKTRVYFTTGATFVFLTGNHSLATGVDLQDISDVTLRANDSDSNVIHRNGATIVCKNVTKFKIEGLTFVLSTVGFNVFDSKLWLSKLTFSGSGVTSRAIDCIHSDITVERCVFEGNNMGAISAGTRSNITLIDSIFSSNRADYGSAVYAQESNITLTGNTLDKSRAENGGVVYVQGSTIALNGNSFHENTASVSGGAVYAPESNITLNGNIFSANVAVYGGAIYALDSSITTTVANVFMHNSATLGGALYFDNCTFDTEGSGSEDLPENITYNRTSTLQPNVEYFFNNTADDGGGGVALVHSSNARLHNVKHNVNFTDNSGSALYSDHSNVTISGATRFEGNHGHMGGGIFLAMSFTSLSGYTLFESNSANYGGAVGGLESKIKFSGQTLFQLNTAHDGGALYASGTDISFSDYVNITSNNAIFGGAMYFNSAATLTFKHHTKLTTSQNHASEYGGVIFHDDTPTEFQCNYVMSGSLSLFLPVCFMHLKVTTTATISDDFSINSYEDSAGKGGSYLYGGLLDKCLLDLTRNGGYTMDPYALITEKIFPIESEVTSEPYYLLFCEGNYPSRNINIQVYRGQEFKVSLLAHAQGNIPTSTLVTVKIDSTASLKLNQSAQTISQQCTTLSYNLYSIKNQEELMLYVDGPCRDAGKATAIVNVTFLPCPDAFIQNRDRCTCDKRLQVFGANCVVGEPSYIVRKAGSRFWMSTQYNKSYQGLIVCKVCPMEYCRSDNINITLDNLDIQCDLNRSGVLCGACATNYSLMLGSFPCQVCSNTYLALLVPFAAAGIALVVFLTFLRLTVATGMINSLILYANIVQVNKHIFLPADHTCGFLNVFIAWLNLDLGIQTCFYNGMDAYAQTWLQFAFPVYVWILIFLIILTSRYSITVSKLIGSNPIAVLATLLLMSYTKILNIIVEVYSSVNLDYPDNKTVTVWLKDANVPYLQSKHLLLTVVTSLVFAFLFLPYTLLLLLGHKFYRYSGKKCFCWLNKLKPLLDSYYAPYKIHTRYWTGFMLLVRCTLYIEFSFGTTKNNLLAIIITFTAAGYMASGRIYSKFYTNLVEISLYLNLVTLSAATATDTNPPALVYTLLGIAFATMIGIFVYHLHISYTAALWPRLKAKLITLKEIIVHGKADQAAYTPLLNAATSNTALDQQKSVSQSFVSIRELDNTSS